MNAWLITGGAGFIGSNFVRMAHERIDAKLIVLDALTYAGDLARIDDILTSSKVEFIKGDICDTELVQSIFKKHQISKVIHFAAESHVDRSIFEPHAFIKTNVEGTLVLLEAARKAWGDRQDACFLQVSTDEVFGALGPDDPPFNESSPYQPNNPYSASKAASDHLVWAWHHTFGLPTIISNCSNNYGPWQYPEKFIPLMIFNALEGKPLPVYGDGLQVRDWLHVEDHCEALLTILEKGSAGETYTIGGNNERKNMYVVNMIADAVDDITGNPKGTSHELIRYVKDRPGHDRRYAIDSSRLQRELGWHAMFVFEDALYDLVGWYIWHKEWVDSVRAKDYSNSYKKQYGDI
ncbi:GDP-mannose 4,6-dehydratase [uncultured archaeon]|nr:GDP-mannose 4,6-dehydratase [uncultured archaeon]